MTRDQKGQVGGIEGIAFGVLVFAFGSLVVANTWALIDAKSAAGSAAREAARAFVESTDSEIDAALAEAEAAAADAMVGYGRDPALMVFMPEDARLERCAPVTMRVEYPVPLITIPLLGRYGRGFTAVGHHSEIVDPFRSGVPDRGTCFPGLQP